MQMFRILFNPRKLLRLVRTDMMLQNSLYLMMSTGIMAAFGFVFWLIGARLYTTEEIGLSSTLVTATTTLTMFSMLGFDNALVRFLPTAKHRDRVINTSITAAGLTALLVAGLFLLALPALSPQLADIIDQPLPALLFVGALLLFTLNVITDSLFVSFQRAKYILIADIGLSLIKVSLPFFLVTLSAIGLFSGFVGSVIASTIISLIFLSLRFDYRYRPALDWPILQRIARFSGSTYIAGLIGAVPAVALPIIVTNMLGAPMAAFFNLATTIAAVLYIVPRATASSFFAQGAKDETHLVHHYLTALRHAALILVPAVIAACLLGQYALKLFGPEYAQATTELLRIMAVSSLLLGFNVITVIILKIRHRLASLIAIEAIGAVTMIGLTWPFLIAFGFTGAGWAWLAGQAVMSACLGLAVVPIIRSHRHTTPNPGQLLLESTKGLS